MWYTDLTNSFGFIQTLMGHHFDMRTSVSLHLFGSLIGHFNNPLIQLGRTMMMITTASAKVVRPEISETVLSAKPLRCGNTVKNGEGSL